MPIHFPFELLSPQEQAVAKASLAADCHHLLESRRDAFSVGPYTFAVAVWREPTPLKAPDSGILKVVRASTIRRILDWAENDWPMNLGDFLSGMFWGKEWDRETPPWQLIPTIEDRMSAESLGLDHLYPNKSTP